VRIIDSETHVLNPTGLEFCYPMDVTWRYPYIPGALPTTPGVIAQALKADAWDNLTDELLVRMDRHGIERAVVMRGAFPAHNAQLAAVVAKHPDRFLAFAGWDLHQPVGDPPVESPAALAALERGFTEFGFPGCGEFELGRFLPRPAHEAYLGFVPTLELCRRYKRPIMFHTSYDGGPTPMAYKDPMSLERLISDFPDVPILIAHMGKYDVTFFESALMLARRRSNVYLTTSNTRSAFVERAVEEVGAERLIFGSDWSMQHGIIAEKKGFDVYAKNLDVVRLANIDEGEKRLILGENLAGLLAL
jgi:predicted TIM-barrel fold metal-dependent hydrolase